MENYRRNALFCILGIVGVAIVTGALWLCGLMFEFDLWVVFGKDAPFVVDVLAGFVCSAFLIPVTVVLWVLQLIGAHTPLVHF